MKTLMSRIISPTPSWFSKIIKIGLSIGAVGAILVAAPIGLPAIIVTIGGYMVTAGLVASAVAKTAQGGE